MISAGGGKLIFSLSALKTAVYEPLQAVGLQQVGSYDK
jgi:hypothetical protein